jgi:hypothetical protein
MTYQPASHRGHHPVEPVAAFSPDTEQLCAVDPPCGRPRRRRDPLGATARPPGPPERGTPPIPAAEDSDYRTTQVSLLAATALGLAFSSGSTDGNVHTLTRLGAPDADIFLEASAAVLELAVGPRRTRVLAADLLGRAARICA